MLLACYATYAVVYAVGILKLGFIEVLALLASLICSIIILAFPELLSL
jgi:hypothetical protein